MRLYSPVDLTGNVNMIGKLVLALGWDWNRGPPDPQPDALTSAPSSHAIKNAFFSKIIKNILKVCYIYAIQFTPSRCLDVRQDWYPIYYPEGMKARVSPMQSIKPHRILAPTWPLKTRTRDLWVHMPQYMPECNPLLPLHTWCEGGS